MAIEQNYDGRGRVIAEQSLTRQLAEAAILANIIEHEATITSDASADYVAPDNDLHRKPRTIVVEREYSKGFGY